MVVESLNTMRTEVMVRSKKQIIPKCAIKLQASSEIQVFSHMNNMRWKILREIKIITGQAKTSE